jgi:hypothetical protein
VKRAAVWFFVGLLIMGADSCPPLSSDGGGRGGVTVPSVCEEYRSEIAKWQKEANNAKSHPAKKSYQDHVASARQRAREAGCSA